MSHGHDNDFGNTQELFDFLQGTIPKGHEIVPENVPYLTPDQAWTVIWYLGNKYWQVTDRIKRCDVCGDLYDTHSEGDCLDYGEAPYHFCDSCMYSDEYDTKKVSDPDEAIQ